jgi:hypothetical protein
LVVASVATVDHGVKLDKFIMVTMIVIITIVIFLRDGGHDCDEDA